MDKILFFLLFLATANCFYIDDSVNGSSRDKIVGGEYVDIKKVPYLAQILRYGQQICGGSIISEHWILTAAHCMEIPKNISVVTGTSEQNKGGTRHRVTRIIVHKDYNVDTVDNDIALLKVFRPIKFDENQKPVPITKTRPSVGDNVTICGFGKEGEYLPNSQIVKAATVGVVDTEYCSSVYAEEGDEITENMFCAGHGDTDSCQGDSGGPAVVDGALVGIVSFGDDCGSEKFPGVYTQLYNYRDWIANRTKLQI